MNPIPYLGVALLFVLGCQSHAHGDEDRRRQRHHYWG
mgnify:CR=1 FL=1